MDFPFMPDTWVFGYSQLKDEWLRYMGMERLPFETEWLHDRLVASREYLALLRLGPLSAPMSLLYTGEEERENIDVWPSDSIPTLQLALVWRCRDSARSKTR